MTLYAHRSSKICACKHLKKPLVPQTKHRAPPTRVLIPKSKTHTSINESNITELLSPFHQSSYQIELKRYQEIACWGQQPSFNLLITSFSLCLCLFILLAQRFEDRIQKVPSTYPFSVETALFDCSLYPRLSFEVYVPYLFLLPSDHQLD